MSAAQITVRINGDVRAVPAGLTLDAVLRHCGYEPRLVVVEFNGEILSRSRWPEQVVVDGDGLEIVTIVGGGS
ncbi:MAG: sulfur carrier protein ThiS [Cyanobacteriota bacterium]